MIAHLRALSLIQLVRFAVGMALGIALIWSSNPDNIPLERHPRLEPHDLMFFRVAGWVLVGMALLRGTHGLQVLLSIFLSRWGLGSRSRKWGGFLRRLGLALAVVDLVDLTAFPITTGCGAYGFLIYRHPDIRDFFEGVFSGSKKPIQQYKLPDLPPNDKPPPIFPPEIIGLG
jgi:hypothetical protein